MLPSRSGYLLEAVGENGPPLRVVKQFMQNVAFPGMVNGVEEIRHTHPDARSLKIIHDMRYFHDNALDLILLIDNDN